MNYFICGFSGAGKSYLLQELALRGYFRNYQLIDLDNYIAKNHTSGEGLGEFIRQVGLEHFRELERKSLAYLSQFNNCVIALGGGSLRQDTAEYLACFSGFWLDTPFEQCYTRICGDSNRPLSGLPKPELETLYQQRRRFYSAYPSIRNTTELMKLVKER